MISRIRVRLAPALLLGSVLALTACVPNTIYRNLPYHAPPQPSTQTSQTLSLIDYATRLANTTPAGRRRAVETARAEAQKAPGATTYARLAIALARPHQTLYTPDEAARYAGLALDADDAHWDDNAHLYLSDLARLLKQATRDDSADRKQIADLQQQLSAARAKLSALSNIENQLDATQEQP